MRTIHLFTADLEVPLLKPPSFSPRAVSPPLACHTHGCDMFWQCLNNEISMALPSKGGFYETKETRHVSVFNTHTVKQYLPTPKGGGTIMMWMYLGIFKKAIMHPRAIALCLGDVVRSQGFITGHLKCTRSDLRHSKSRCLSRTWHGCQSQSKQLCNGSMQGSVLCLNTVRQKPVDNAQ